MSNGSGSYASYFSGTNVSIVKNEFSYCGSSCMLLTNLGYKTNKDIFIKDNSFYNYDGSGIRLGTQGASHEKIFISNNSFSNGGSYVTANSWYTYAKLPDYVDISFNHSK